MPQLQGFPRLTNQQQVTLAACHRQLQLAPQWHGRLPVLLLDRCWLKLRVIPIEQLAQVLPPDTSAEAPELVSYHVLLQQGYSPWSAEQHCWQEFGQAAWQEALHRFWGQQERGNHDWTWQHYLQLIDRYRKPWTTGLSRHLPLIVLARQDQREAHQLLWLDPRGQPMRHTCL